MEKYVWVVRQKGDWQKGKVRLEDLSGVHWDNISGGARIKSGMWGLYGYIMCDQIIEGEIGHSGIHGPCPHNIKVHIQKCDNEKSIYEELLARGGKRPIEKWRKGNAAEKIREIVAVNPGITALELYEQLDDIDINTIKNSIKYLEKRKFKNKCGLRLESFGRTRKLYIREIGEE